MPNAPLYYQPLMLAKLASTKIGDSTLAELRDKQLSYDIQLDPSGRPMGATAATPAAVEFDKTPLADKLGSSMILGIAGLQAALPGATPLTRYQFATSAEGAVANRIDTTLRNQGRELLDTLTPEAIPQLGAQLVQAAQAQIETKGDMRFAGTTMDVGLATTGLMLRHAEGKQPLTSEEVVKVATEVGREVQRSVTPKDPGASTPIDWIEDATAIMGAHWPGAVAKTAQALGLSDKFDELEFIASGERMKSRFIGPEAKYVSSLTSLLGAAGIDTESADAAPAAFQVLQASPLEGVPAGIAQALLAKAKLPTDVDSIKYIGDRIVETTGSEGNVTGLLAQIELQRRDSLPPEPEPAPPSDPKQPPPSDEPPVPLPGPTPDEPPAPEDPPVPLPGPTPDEPPAPDEPPVPLPGPTPGPAPGEDPPPSAPPQGGPPQGTPPQGSPPQGTPQAPPQDGPPQGTPPQGDPEAPLPGGSPQGS